MNNFLGRRGFVKSVAAGVATAMLPPVWAQDNSYDVIVIGAGLSGLHTAYLLEQQGLNVLLLESSNRLGGRVYTLDHIEGHPDAGATQVGSNYLQLRNIVERLNVPLISTQAAQANGALSVRGQIMYPNEWATHEANILPEHEREVSPSTLLWKYLTQSAIQMNSADWLKGEYQHLDIPLDVHLKSLGTSDEALRLINSNFESDDISEVSALHTLRKISVLLRSGGAEFVKNGTSRIPEAMAASLIREPLTGKKVTSIKTQNNRVVVSCSDTSIYSAKRCVLATPFSTTRKLDLQLDIREEKRKAIANLAYNHITQVYMRPKSEYWEEDKYRPDMWTDSPIGMVTSELDSEKKVTLLRAWLIGNNARLVDSLPKSEIGEIVIKSYESQRPSAKGKLLLEEVVNWGSSPDSLGAYAHFHPGDATSFGSIIAEPEGPLHFVGEHTEFQKSGMEAAVMSAERCAKELIASL